jgi:hypothetical protein
VAWHYASLLTLVRAKILIAERDSDGQHTASIQDACLLAMLRISADCESVPGDVIDIVKALLEKPGRYIRRVGVASVFSLIQQFIFFFL